MALIEPGRVCVKIAGREAGNYCVVLEVIDDNFVIVQGPAVRKRRCNIAHLEPLQEKIELSGDVNKIIKEKFGVSIREKKVEEKTNEGDKKK
jgi:large subunit ribosomal protein L14e